MEITLFFGLFFVSIFLAFLAVYKDIIYFGVLGGMIFLILGVTLAAQGGGIERMDCYSNILWINETEIHRGTSPNILEERMFNYTYNQTCSTTSISFAQDNLNIMGIIMILIGAGMIVDFAVSFNTRRKETGRHDR